MLSIVLVSSGLLVPSSVRPTVTVAHGVARRAVQPVCVAATEDEKALLAASKKVTLMAQKFGPTQGKAAQAWVEESIKGGGIDAEELMTMQLELFAECKLDDDSGRCKDLSDAIEALTSAVAERKDAPKPEGFDFNFATGATPIQEAATKLRGAATLFGPEQKSAADAWIKKITSGSVTSVTGLLEEQVTLFGECVLSEGSTPSNCQQLESALLELQLAVETCAVDSPEECSEEVVVAELAEATAATTGSVKPTGGKRKAIKRFFRRLSGANKLSPLAVASFLAAPGQAVAELEGAPMDELVAALKEEGVDETTISHAMTSVLPFLPGQETPGVPSMEAP